MDIDNNSKKIIQSIIIEISGALFHIIIYWSKCIV
jgi:hypothetical protein